MSALFRVTSSATLFVMALSSTCSLPAQSAVAASTDASGSIAIPAPNDDVLPSQVSQQKSFFARLAQAYRDDWNPKASSGPGPERRGSPGPLDSTPFPSSDYSVGGAPIIGAPDTQTYPLMEAINQNRSRTKIYGWFNSGFNISTSNRGVGANSPAAYYYTPNKIVPDQQVLYIERLPNTVQTEHFDWGFRFAQLYGQDYRYTTSKGIFSQQLLLNNNPRGYDPVMFYVDFYFPHVAKGMNIRMGRYISLPDIEAQLAPNNYTYSHSLLYTIDPYTTPLIRTPRPASWRPSSFRSTGWCRLVFRAATM